MAEKKPQTYANHTRFVPGYHFLLSLILLVNLSWALWGAYKDFAAASLMTVLLAIGLVLLFYYARAFPIAVQDRLIRLEERLRFREVLPEELQGRVGEISLDQMIGLRFASEGEVEGLVREVLSGDLRERNEIKKKVRDWRADHCRC